MDSDGRYSAPFSRCPLRFTGTVLSGGSSTPRDQPLETRGAGRGWRDRLASTKALLTVGTESACREALGILHTFIDAATATDAPLLTHDDTLEPVFGPVELRLCAQCLVLALRVCSKEALLWRRLSPSGLLTQALEQCAMCATNSALQQLMLTSGVIAVLVPLLNAHARNATDSTKLLLPALKTICSLAGWPNATSADHLPQLIAALSQLLTDVAPASVAELAARAIGIFALSDQTRNLVVESDALPRLVQACRQALAKPALAAQAARAIGHLAEDESNDHLLVQHGGVLVLLQILNEADEQIAHPEFKDVVVAACEGLISVVSHAVCRRAVVEAHGIKPLANIVSSKVEQQSKAAGWILVSMAVDPELGDAIVKHGLAGLIEHARSHDERCQEESAWALANLLGTSASAVGTAMALMEAESPCFLLGMLRASSISPKLVMQLIWAVANLTVQEPLKKRLGEQGFAKELVRLLTFYLDTMPGAKEDDGDTIKNILVQTTRALANLAVDASNCQRMGADGIRTIVRAAGVPSVAEAATRALINLSCDSDVAHQMVAESTLDSLVSLIELHGEDAVREQAARVLLNLARLDVQSQMCFITTGTLRRMSRLMREDFRTRKQNKTMSCTEASCVDLKNTSVQLQATCAEVMAALGAVLTPASRRALISASMLSVRHDGMHPGVKRTSRRGSCLQRRPSPLSASLG